jgi:hypothetical protein
MAAGTKDNDNTFNGDFDGFLVGTDASVALGENSTSNRAGRDITSNRTINGEIGNTSGSNNTIFGAGSTYVESIDPETIKGAFDFGTAALTGSNALASQYLTAFEKSQLKNQEFQSNLLSGFQGIAEATGSTLRDALATTLQSETLAKPADTSAGRADESANLRLAYIGAGLLALLFFFPRQN